MHFAQHLIISWFVGEGAGVKTVTGRRIVAWAGCVPDLDVLPYAVATGYHWLGDGMGFREALQYSFRHVHEPIHHRYTHGIGFIVLTGLVAAAIQWWSISRARKAPSRDAGAAPPRCSPLYIACLAMLTSLLHALGDVLASGPNWPIYPLMPFSDMAWGYRWSWTLADWPNIVLLVLCLVALRQYAVWRGRSAIEAFSVRADRFFVHLVRTGQVRSGA